MRRREQLERELNFIIGDCKTKEEKIAKLKMVVNTVWNFNAEQAYAFEMSNDNPSTMARVWASTGECQELLDIYLGGKEDAED